MINSLAYCTQAVVDEAEAMAGVEKKDPPPQAEPAFEIAQLREHLEAALAALRGRSDDHYEPVAASLEKIAGDLETHHEDSEELEQRLTVLEEKMAAIARIHQSEDALLEGAPLA